MRVAARQGRARSEGESMSGEAGQADAGEPADALEHGGWDPKDGELCLGRAKPGETLVEVRSGTDVQIVRRIRV